MPDLLAPQRAQRGWVVAMTPEMAKEAAVAEGSLLVFYLGNGGVMAEILPPATEEMRHGIAESINKFGEAFAELKRLGD